VTGRRTWNKDAANIMPTRRAHSLYAALIPFAWRLPNGIKGASDEDLESSGDVCEIWSWICGGLVVLGVFTEAAIAWFHPPYDSPWEQWGSTLANAAVVLGVAGEIQFSMMAFRRDKELKRRSDERVAEANNIAAQAIKDAATARERTAVIEKLTAWRRIDPDFRRKLSDAFRDTAPVLRLRIEYQLGDPEAFTYARDFAQTFTDLGVKEIVFLSNAHMGVTVFGVAIEIGECEQSDDLHRACLETFAVDIKPRDFGRRHSDPGLPTPNLYMFVGPKPPIALDQTA
jgi:hypothetical protein